jgi:hypothetical protein
MANPVENKPSKTQLARSSPGADISILKMIAECELLTQGPPLTAGAKNLMVSLWRETWDQIGETRFAEAFRMALASTTYRVSIAEIRRFAGLTTTPPIEAEATAALHWLIGTMRVHKRIMGIRRGYQQPGGGFKFDRDGPDVLEALLPPQRTSIALVNLGFGSYQAGLDVIWQHPALDEARSGDEMDQLRMTRGTQAAERIERKFKDAYIGVAGV